MSYHLDETICAIATAPGGAARGMVRVSGRDALAVVAPLFRTDDGLPLEVPTRATTIAGNLRISLGSCPASSEDQSIGTEQEPAAIVPCDLFVWPTKRSYTREAVVELHTFGSDPILQAILTAVCCAGARLAEPGEFTLRAFLAGRIDLTQAEAVLGVIDASRAEELDAALAQLAGGLAQPLHAVRGDLLQLLAELEAGLDFVEEDIQFVSRHEVLGRLDSASQLLANVHNQLMSRQSNFTAYQIALVGPPNAGKSSLFNALVKRYGSGGAERLAFASEALVSPERGTTRDYLIATISLNDISCELIDTAGVEACDVRQSESSPFRRSGEAAKIDRLAAALGAERSKQATVRALCLEARQFNQAANDENLLSGTPACNVLVLTKSDLLEQPITIRHTVPMVLTSSITGDGLAELGNAIRGVLASAETAHRGYAVASTADRCRESIRLAAGALAGALELAEHEGGSELIAVDIRSALDELGKVVGAIYTEDLLDRIFSTFCIGK